MGRQRMGERLSGTARRQCLQAKARSKRMAEERIRPLRWVKGIGKLDPQQVQRLLQRLFREGPSVVMELEELGCKMLDELTGSSHTKPHDESIIVLSAMFFDGSAASRSLLCDGYVRAGCSQIRCSLLSFSTIVRGEQKNGIARSPPRSGDHSPLRPSIERSRTANSGRSGGTNSMKSSTVIDEEHPHNTELDQS